MDRGDDRGGNRLYGCSTADGRPTLRPIDRTPGWQRSGGRSNYSEHRSDVLFWIDVSDVASSGFPAGRPPTPLGEGDSDARCISGARSREARAAQPAATPVKPARI